MNAAHDPAMRVLLVDDEPDQVELYRYGLEDAGYVVVSVAGGEAAIAIARDVRPAVVVLDLRLRDIDGWQVCAALKSDARTWAIPIVILTAAASSTLAQDAARAGCAASLLKPCYPSDLLHTLRAVIAAAQKFGV
jgi:CheY-like chemotaxis protein